MSSDLAYYIYHVLSGMGRQLISNGIGKEDEIIGSLIHVNFNPIKFMDLSNIQLWDHSKDKKVVLNASRTLCLRDRYAPCKVHCGVGRFY